MRKKFGTRVKNVPSMMQLNCDIRTRREQSYLYANQKYDVTELMKYLDKKKKKGEHITFFQAFLTALGKVFYNRPVLNRFVKNRRIYEHPDVSFAFVAKVGFDDSAHITLPAISKTGHTCRWAKGSSNGSQSSGGSQVTITSNTTFYAKCEKITLTATPYNFQYDPGSNWVCLYGKAGTYQADTPYACLSEEDVQEMGGPFHGGSVVSWTAYCYHCCPATKQGLQFTRWDLTTGNSCVYEYQ